MTSGTYKKNNMLNMVSGQILHK